MGKLKPSVYNARMEAADRRSKDAAEAAAFARYEAQKAAATELPVTKLNLAPEPVAASQVVPQAKFLTPVKSTVVFPPTRDEEMGSVELLTMAHQVYAIAIPIGMLTLITGALAYQFWSILTTFIPAVRA